MLRGSGREEITLMATAYINIGSNLGDRAALIERAVAALEAALGVVARRAPVVESPPWGFDSPNRFLNLGIAVETSLPPLELLDLVRAVERDIDASPHRTPDGLYADRTIDIDLIAVDDVVMESERLTLPHPRMHQRRFVLEPMARLAPVWRHPLSGLTAAEMLALL